MNKLFALLFSVLTLPAFSQKAEIIDDPNATLRTLNSSFKAISVTDGVQLYLTQGDEESIAVSANEEKYLERYKTEVVNGVLKIYYDNKGIPWTGSEKRNLKAYVSFKAIEKLTASGGAVVKMKSVLNGDKVSANFTSGARFNGEIAIVEMDITQNSGAIIEISGKSDKLNVEASSGAIFNGYDLLVEYCNARASSGGSVKLSVNKELNVKASSGGGIRYKGNGVVKDMNVNSGGIVKKG